MELVVDWNSVCLVCLQEGEMKSIYEKDGKNVTLSEKIMRCSSIEIQHGMILPEQICLPCCDDLQAAYRFRNNCESTNIILKSLLSSSITNLELSQSNGDIYNYKLPSGLNVKRVKTSEITPSQIEVKAESLPPQIQIDDNDDDEEVDEDEPEQYEDEQFVVNDNDYDEDDEPLANMKKLNEEHIEESIAEMLEQADKDQEMMNVKIEQSTYEERQSSVQLKKGRQKKSKPMKSPNKLKMVNVQALVEGLTTITYARKNRDDEKPPKICEICGNSYKYQHALESHMRRHRNEKPFSCEFCTRAFVANVELRRHMRVHTGQKPYPCRYCSRRFSDFGSRIKHERSHTGERPYECSTCGKTFAYAHVLSVHILTHTGEKKFKCEKCGKGFTKKAYLSGHMKLHSDILSDVIEVQVESQEEEIKDNEIIYLPPKLENEDVEIYIEELKPSAFTTK